jgi:hypothetical protein
MPPEDTGPLSPGREGCQAHPLQRVLNSPLEGSAPPEGVLCNTAHWGTNAGRSMAVDTRALRALPRRRGGASPLFLSRRWDTSRALLLARSPRVCDTLARQKCPRIAGRNVLECGPKNRSINPRPKARRWVWHPSTRSIRTRSSCEICDAEEPFTPRGCIAQPGVWRKYSGAG